MMHRFWRNLVQYSLIFAKRRVALFSVYIATFVVAIVFPLFVVAEPVHAAVDKAEGFIFPMRVWQLVTHQGDYLWNSTYHMGVDLGGELGVGAPVYAVADGVVKEVRVRTSFGLVVLIEHTLPDGSKVVSLSGHLKPTDRPVKEGQVVKVGTRIGSLGDSTENGGWSPHLHFGIHKSPYSSTWIYYGHVKSQSTEANWHDPESFIVSRLANDVWNPQLGLDLSSSSYVGNQLRFSVLAQDIGSRVSSVVVELTQDDRRTWKTVAQFGSGNSYPYRVTTGLPNVDSGNSYLRVTVKDAKGNQTQNVVRLTRNLRMSMRVGAAVMKTAGSAGLTHLTFQAGGVERSLSPFNSEVKKGGDIAVGDVTGDGVNEIIAARAGVNPFISIVNTNGAELEVFKAFGYGKQNHARIAAGDVNGDGKDEVIVGFGKGVQQHVRVFSGTGALLSQFVPFDGAHEQGVDVATGDIDGNGVDEILIGGRGGKKKTQVGIYTMEGTRRALFNAIDYRYKSGVNISAGDVDQDGRDEVIMGTKKYSRGAGRVIVVQDPLLRASKRTKTTYYPFGSRFSGEIDVATQDNEGDGKMEIVMSQASLGEAWVKTYRFDEAKSVLSVERVFESSHRKGARVAGWK